MGDQICDSHPEPALVLSVAEGSKGLSASCLFHNLHPVRQAHHDADSSGSHAEPVEV